MKRLAITLPTVVTLIRLVISPLVMPTLLVMLLPTHSSVVTGLLALLFSALAATDFLDGYIARQLGQESLLGALLDPIADKILMASTLIALVAVGRVYYLWAIIFIGREFLVMGLREVARAHGMVVPVMWSGKVKMFLQVMYIMIVIITSKASPQSSWVVTLEQMSLVAAVVSTFYSAFVYFRYFYRAL
jgi:CDP-diacylglycerol--glycerol-3-phosphate 3-phosphatidyltransferase